MSKQHIVKVIKKGMEARNTVAHSLRSSPRYQRAARMLEFVHFDEFQEFLLCVSDMLWVLDYLWLRFHKRDANWALERARPISRSSLGLERHLA